MYRKEEVGRLKTAVGRIRVQSTITGETMRFCFGMMYWGDHNLSGCIRPCVGQEPEDTFINEVFDNFSRAAFLETLSVLEKYLGASAYSLRNLFKDEQRRIINIILDSTLANTEWTYRQIYETNAPLLRFLKDIGIPAPRALSAAAGYFINAMLKRSFEEEVQDIDAIKDLMENARIYGINLDASILEITIRHCIENIVEKLIKSASDMELLLQVEAHTNIIQDLPFEINLRKVQDFVYDMLQTRYPDFMEQAEKQDETAKKWVSLFKTICNNLSLSVTP